MVVAVNRRTTAIRHCENVGSGLFKESAAQVAAPRCGNPRIDPASHRGLQVLGWHELVAVRVALRAAPFLTFITVSTGVQVRSPHRAFFDPHTELANSVSRQPGIRLDLGAGTVRLNTMHVTHRTPQG